MCSSDLVISNLFHFVVEVEGPQGADGPTAVIEITWAPAGSSMRWVKGLAMDTVPGSAAGEAADLGLDMRRDTSVPTTIEPITRSRPMTIIATTSQRGTKA